MTRAALPLFDDGLLALPLYEDRHRELARSLQGWVEKHAGVPQRLAALSPSQRGVEYTRLLGRDGWLQHALGDPSRADGRPDLRSVCLIRQALAQLDDLCDFAFAIHGLACAPILWWGTPAQRERLLPALRGGLSLGSLALSEPNAGSNLAAAAAAATRAGDAYVLDGTKTWVSNADIADFHCVLARTGEGPGAMGLSLFRVPAGTPGLAVSEPIALVAPRSFGSLRLNDCRLEADALIGTSGMGYRYAMEILDFYRVSVAAAALGFCRRAADASLAWSRERQVFGAPLFDLQLTKDKLAGMAVVLDAAALLTARAAWAFDTGRAGTTQAASVAKLYATDQAQQVVDDALQLFGAAGLVEGSTTEQLYRQIRSLRIYEGSSEIQKLIIATCLAKQTRRAAVPAPPAAEPERGAQPALMA